MENTGKYIKAGIGYTVGNYLLKGVSVITLPLFVNLMTSAEYGDYNNYTAFEAILSILLGLALFASVKNAKYKYPLKQDFDSYISSCVYMCAIATVGVLILANISFSIISPLIDMDRFVLNVLIIHSFSSSLIALYNAYISLEYKYQSFFKVSAVNAISSVALSLVFMFTVFSNRRDVGRIMGNAIPMILIGFIIAFYFLKRGHFSLKKEFCVYGLIFSLPLIFHGVSQVILSQFDRIMIKTMTSSSEAGIYSFSYNVSSLVFITSSSLQQVWGPWFFERMAEKNLEVIKEKSNMFGFGMMLFVAIALLVSPDLITVMSLGKEDYSGGVYYIIPIMIGHYYAFLYNMPAQVEYYYEKTKYIAIGTGLAAGFNIVLNYWGIKTFGSVAAAYTTFIVYFLYFIIHFFIAKQINGNSLFNLTKFLLYGLILIVIGLLTLLFAHVNYIRWALVVAILGFFIIWLNKRVHIMPFIKKHFFNHSK